MSEEARKLADKYGGVWAEHAHYPLADWQHEVSENNTRASYWDWVLSEIETRSIP